MKMIVASRQLRRFCAYPDLVLLQHNGNKELIWQLRPPTPFCLVVMPLIPCSALQVNHHNENRAVRRQVIEGPYNSRVDDATAYLAMFLTEVVLDECVVCETMEDWCEESISEHNTLQDKHASVAIFGRIL